MKLKCLLFGHDWELCDFIKTKHWIWNIYYCKRCRKIKLMENPKDDDIAYFKYEKNNLI